MRRTKWDEASVVAEEDELLMNGLQWILHVRSDSCGYARDDRHRPVKRIAFLKTHKTGAQDTPGTKVPNLVRNQSFM